jgi:hypothetical protein
LDDEHLYGLTQSTEGVSDGDIFVDADMGIVGFMYSYHPVVVTVERGGEGRRGLDYILPEFFQTDGPSLMAQYGESIRLAVDEAKSLGFPVRPEYETLLGRTARRRTAGPMDRNRPVKVHNFPDAVDGGHLYAYTQCTDGVLDGDVFVGKDIGIVGYMTEAWPVAVTVEVGGLHTLLAESFFDEDYAHQYGESIRIALGEAKRLGFAVDPDFTDMIGRTARRHTASDDHYDGPPEYEGFYENFDEGAEDDFQLWADDNDIPEERRDDPDVRQRYADGREEYFDSDYSVQEAFRSRGHESL